MRNKSSLTLLEIIIMVMVFALAAALCLRAFVYSKKLSAQDKIRVLAERQVQTAAEVIKAAKGDAKTAAAILSGMGQEGNAFTLDNGFELLYNQDWKPHPVVSGYHCHYVIRVEVSKDGYLGKAVITALDSTGTELYSLVSSWQELQR